jgi:hypothetical protein
MLPAMPNDPRQIVCMNCLNRQRRLLEPCEKCARRNFASVRFLIQQHGPDWKLVLEADRGKVH